MVVYSLMDLLQVLEAALCGFDQIEAVLVLLDLNIYFPRFGSFRNHHSVWETEQIMGTYAGLIRMRYA